MATRQHDQATTIHLGAYWQAGDPGAIGAGKMWLDTSGATPALKSRNAANTGWDLVSQAGVPDQGTFTYFDGTVAAAPAAPAAGKLRLYAKTGKVLAVKDDAGLETVLGGGGGAGARVLLFEHVVGTVGGEASVDTGVLPATSKNLTVVWSAKGTGLVNLLTASTFLRMQLNGLGGGMQALMSGLDGAAASAITSGAGNASGAPIGFMPNGNSVYWGSGRIEFPDYNGAKVMQGVLSCAWSDWNGAAGGARTRQGGYTCDGGNGPLTRMVFTSDTGNIAQNSVISVYGDS